MKRITILLSQDRLYLAGIILIIISAMILAVTDQFTRQSASGAFFFNYALSAGYLFVLLFGKVSKRGLNLSERKIGHIIMLLVLWFISAFALNREMNVFDQSVPWLSVWIVLSSVALILASMYQALPGLLNYITFFLLGGAFLLFSYYAIYLLPLYVFSIIGIIAIGISLHTYVPLGLAIVTAILILSVSRQNIKMLYMAIAGFALPVIGCISFLICWNTANQKINLLINQNALNDAKLPAWINVSQHIDNSFWAERILKAGLVYHEVSNDHFFWGGMPSHSFDEPKQHDPLVVIATLLFKKPNLDENDRIKVLKSMYNSRHQAQERLWSGDNLETISVISNVKLFPEYRMAYTEKMLTVRNNADWNWSKQEAIYTFHLSEGAVISSLSLWIDGREAKSRLTTKATADSAYHQVVGVEQHDPSVVHWQEGNTVTVRVFPCTTTENRRFKIGITSPLTKKGDKLIYENASFEGPQAGNALESMQVTTAGNASELQLPAVFKQTTLGVYRADRTYQPDWQIACKAPALATSAFSFADTAYQVKNYEAKLEDFTPDKIYLDLNKSWSESEFNQIWDKIKTRPVYVYDDKLMRLTDDNVKDVFDIMSQQNFSMFPVNAISDPARALIISKSTDSAPNLSDLEGSDFEKDLTTYLKVPTQIRFYNIGNQLSPYLKALKELRIFNYTDGEPKDLIALLDQHQFVKNQEDDQTVVLNNAKVMIQKTTSTDIKNAPDHVLRLFAYNDLMKKVSGDYFNHNYVQPANIAEAEKAFIVSPVSSLIVLETQEDYNRFGIDENKNSLKNASMKSSGAVPEPQEWLLIVLCLGVAAYVLYSKKLKPQNL
ncbi:XrtN system VIT domain-containing protein [Mucilaginibacter jinjuensis]|uniref:XrtN system VIT domain-containing protein n=1 Tax=Mucilaginibacter jinjuensis TaxID=1176721 RepID=A0ABY7T4C7_9SPHI|nr:XrtN system VIT domain-containing protein [Mucilaginibacter jinjuensis]WCT11050.1 XrtN system VIT domain-containing protein [Mucilaginibacter jinjuensis]